MDDISPKKSSRKRKVSSYAELSDNSVDSDYLEECYNSRRRTTRKSVTTRAAKKTTKKAEPEKAKTPRKKAATVKAEEAKPKRTRATKAKADSSEAENAKSTKVKKAKGKIEKKENMDTKESRLPQYDPEYVKKLATGYPDNYFVSHADAGLGMIQYINEEHPLKLVDVDMRDQGPIVGMSLSPDGSMLATFCHLGDIKIWDLDTYTMIQKLRDNKEPNIDEFYVGRFVPNQLLIAGGKLKDRTRWSDVDEDNHILPCPLKIFDVVSGDVVSKLEGHTEEILCIKLVQFKGANYIISTSQDGYIIKWQMGADWKTLIEMTRMEDGITCMAFTISFVPNTGNKYFVSACDDTLRLYDFENAQLVKTFENMYSSYCDCGKFIRCLDLPEPEEEEDAAPFAYFISRGVELLDAENNTIASRPNTCTLHKLIYPTVAGGEFQMEEVRKFQHNEYLSNSWLIKITSNGRYLMAPTLNGQVYVFSLATGQTTAVLRDHEELEVRDVLFHPTRNLFFTTSDDGCIKVYTSAEHTQPPGPPEIDH
ncbi:WD40 repeat-like protein [Basidiobolus meristosporus CBS 931.73]|uniref:WD40 repeat-like protein n=1 Tax=Basidiobolus meristosporus CBS 931.73 TaxID=1314790 RepID=A0A1Y1YP32_9FUNG|nr:WD40 repeat-like protein [Basidiobolus meristosporus CBS 931.73]|eukprot:ORX99738.1 WD40 repeat-like protein [Basidiobolus meristosporus CBS 931.73]